MTSGQVFGGRSGDAERGPASHRSGTCPVDVATGPIERLGDGKCVRTIQRPSGHGEVGDRKACVDGDRPEVEFIEAAAQ